VTPCRSGGPHDPAGAAAAQDLRRTRSRCPESRFWPFNPRNGAQESYGFLDLAGTLGIRIDFPKLGPSGCPIFLARPLGIEDNLFKAVVINLMAADLYRRIPSKPANA